MLVAIFIVVVLLGGTLMFANHMENIRTQAWLDKKHVIAKWLVYSRKYNAYYFGKDGVIVCIDEVEEAWDNLMEAARWYNRKYRKYGYCIPPELLTKFKEEDHETSN